MTTFRILATNCGLSVNQTAAFLKLPVATATAYWKGKRGPRAQDLIKLQALDKRIQSVAVDLIRGIKGLFSDSAAKPPSIRLKRLTTDTAAAAYKLPYASCHEAMMGRVLRNLPSWALERVKFADAVDEDVEFD